jgi:hypothetical protein
MAGPAEAGITNIKDNAANKATKTDVFFIEFLLF